MVRFGSAPSGADPLVDNVTGEKAATYDMIALAIKDRFGADLVNRKGMQNNARVAEFPSLPECREPIRRTKGMEIAAPKLDGVPRRKGHLRIVSRDG